MRILFLLIAPLLLAISSCDSSKGRKEQANPTKPDSVSSSSSNSSDSSNGNILPITLELFGVLKLDNRSSSSIEYYYKIILENFNGQQYLGSSRLQPVGEIDKYTDLTVEASFDGVSLELDGVSNDSNDNEASLSKDVYDCLLTSRFLINDGPESGQWVTSSECDFGQIDYSFATPIAFEALPDCPCVYDESLNGGVEGSGTWSEGFDPSWYHPGASKEIRWTPQNGGPGQQCTYDSEGILITGGLAAGTPDYTSPSSDIFGHTTSDVAPLYLYNCKTYLDLFPPNNGNNCPPNILYPVTGESLATCNQTINHLLLRGWAWGDPHITTFDGLAYDMQAVGEFVFLRSVDDDFELQIRTSPWLNLTTASVITAIAIKNQEDRFGVYVDRANKQLLCRLNDVTIDCNAIDLDLDDGGKLTQHGSDINFLLNDGSHVKLSANLVGGFLNPTVSISSERFARVEGLLGNANNTRADDLQSPSGEIFELLLPFSKFYSEYVEGWRVSDEISLFDYSSGESTETYTNRELPTSIVTVKDLSDSDYNFAVEVCQSKKIRPGSAQYDACLFDVGLTGVAEFADSSSFNARIEGTVDIVPDPTTEFGFSFGAGRPFSGSVETECGEMTLATTNTEPFASSAFRNQQSGMPALVSFTFERPIKSFHLSLGNVREDEYLSDFNIEASTLAGNLTRDGRNVTTSLPFPNDSGSGILSWLNVDTSKIEFLIGGPTGSALAIDGYDIECVF